MEFDTNQPIYLQISDQICENILRKKWESDMRIPSVREFAMSVEVNPNTVVRAYNHLQSEGIIYNKRGIGYYISENAFQKTREIKKTLFREVELPETFRKMQLLDISLEDLKPLFQRYIKEQKNNENI